MSLTTGDLVVPLPKHLLRLGPPQGLAGAEAPGNLVTELHKRLGVVEEQVAALHRRHDALAKKQEDSDGRHRAQLDSATERVFQAECDLRGLQQRQEEAIDKAGAALQSLSVKQQQESQSLAQAVGHAARASQAVDRLTQDLSDLDCKFRCTQQDVANLTNKVDRPTANTDGESVLALRHEVARLGRLCQDQQTRLEIETCKQTRALQEAMAERRCQPVPSKIIEIFEQVATLRADFDRGVQDLLRLSSRIQALERSPQSAGDRAGHAPDAAEEARQPQPRQRQQPPPQQQHQRAQPQQEEQRQQQTQLIQLLQQQLPPPPLHQQAQAQAQAQQHQHQHQHQQQPHRQQQPRQQHDAARNPRVGGRHQAAPTRGSSVPARQGRPGTGSPDLQPPRQREQQARSGSSVSAAQRHSSRSAQQRVRFTESPPGDLPAPPPPPPGPPPADAVRVRDVLLPANVGVPMAAFSRSASAPDDDTDDSDWDTPRRAAGNWRQVAATPPARGQGPGGQGMSLWSRPSDPPPPTVLAGRGGAGAAMPPGDFRVADEARDGATTSAGASAGGSGGGGPAAAQRSRQRRMCAYYTGPGTCRKGDSCHFAHVDEAVRRSPAPATSGTISIEIVSAPVSASEAPPVEAADLLARLLIEGATEHAW